MSNLNLKHLILAIESSCDETSLALLAVPSFINNPNGFNTESDLDLIRNTKIFSSVIASQIKTHAIYGGVVPEIGARMHAEAIHFSWKQLIEQLDLEEFDDFLNSNFPDLDPEINLQSKILLCMDKIMVTTTPGLVSALRVGQEFAKSIQFFAKQTRFRCHFNQKELEICEINHLRGHLASSFYLT